MKVYVTYFYDDSGGDVAELILTGVTRTEPTGGRYEEYELE